MSYAHVPVNMLLDEAEKALRQSYSPYSHFAVGASLWCGEDRVSTGANVENASYGLTVCAERVAVWQAVMSLGLSKQTPWKAIALVAKTTKNGHVVPCGACLQVLSEFAGSDSVVVSRCAETGGAMIQDFTTLFPQSFML